MLLKQSTAVNLTVLMVGSSDHIAGATGLTLTIYGTKAGGTPAAITPTVTELDSTHCPGLYALALTTTHTNTLGEFQLHVTASGADPTDVSHQVIAVDLSDAVHLGISGIPNAAAGTNGGLPLGVDSSGRVDVLKVNGTSQTARDLGANLDTTVSSRLASSSYTAPDNSDISAIKAKTDNLPASPAATSDIPSASTIAAAVWATVIETGYTALNSARLMLAALSGKISGAATTTITIRNPQDTKSRITATVDADGNRSAVSYDLS